MPPLKSHVLQVEVNGKRVASMGLRRRGNGAVIINVRAPDGTKASEPAQGFSAGALEIDGRETYSFLQYVRETELSVGDVVTVRVVKGGKLSVPKSRTVETKRERELRKTALLKQKSKPTGKRAKS